MKKMPLTIPQILLSTAVIVTITTVTDSFIEWENKIYEWIFSFIIALSVFKIVRRLLKDWNSEDSDETVKE